MAKSPTAVNNAPGQVVILYVHSADVLDDTVESNIIFSTVVVSKIIFFIFSSCP